MATPIWYYSAKRLKETLKEQNVPLLAVAASFSFVIMMFNVPLPGGTTGHATGAGLIAILLGPWASIIAVSIALVIQALLFGDGGITAIGANCFNMAIAESFCAYAVYKLLSKGGRWRIASAAIGSYIGINLAAFLTALELGIQPFLHTAPDGRHLYCPFPLSITIPAIMIEHIMIFGVVEALITAIALKFIMKAYPELMTEAK